MDYLGRELSILSRAVAYANLTAAAPHVGVSQPQLSRIVARLESELGVALLNREARRSATWTPVAARIAEMHGRAMRQFFGELQALGAAALPSRVRVGTLEGLIPQAIDLTKALIAASSVRLVELDVEDLSGLEARFARGEFDLILSSREPGRKKWRHLYRLGFQTLGVRGQGATQVMSSFEHGRAAGSRKDRNEKVLVSNSLEIRRAWIDRCGGSGVLPSPVSRRRKGQSDEHPVLLIGSDELAGAYWNAALSPFR